MSDPTTAGPATGAHTPIYVLGRAIADLAYCASSVIGMDAGGRILASVQEAIALEATALEATALEAAAAPQPVPVDANTVCRCGHTATYHAGCGQFECRDCDCERFTPAPPAPPAEAVDPVLWHMAEAARLLPKHDNPDHHMNWALMFLVAAFRQARNMGPKIDHDVAKAEMIAYGLPR